MQAARASFGQLAPDLEASFVPVPLLMDLAHLWLFSGPYLAQRLHAHKVFVRTGQARAPSSLATSFLQVRLNFGCGGRADLNLHEGPIGIRCLLEL